MTKNPVSLDKWRDYFSSSGSDIFSIIEHAIKVAASDCPNDFKLKRDRIAEMLFTCNVTKCLGCNRAELCLAHNDCPKGIGGDGEYNRGLEGVGSKDSKESKVNSNSREDDDDHREFVEMVNADNQVGDQDYDDAEALTDEIEEECQYLGEVVRIKGILDEREGKSEEVLFESLRRLQLMPLTVEILKATEIGKSVNALRKHGSNEIRNLVRQLVEDWKLMVDEWVRTTTAIAGADLMIESAKTSSVDEEVEDEEGLPSPPLDEGAFLTTPASIELSQFFDGLDEDGNIQNCGEFNKNRINVRTRIPEKTEIPTHKFSGPNNSRTLPKDSKDENRRNQESAMKKQSPPCKPNTPVRPKPPRSETTFRRPNPAVQTSANNAINPQENGTIQKKLLAQQKEKSIFVDEASHQMKIEASKRKLHERYQEAEKAKKQRTVQVVEFRDLPKQSVARGNQHARPGNHLRQRMQSRR